MRQGRSRHVTSLLVAVGGLVVLSLGAVDIYVDAVVEGNPLWTTLLENVVSGVVGSALLVAAGWVYRAADATAAARMRYWVVVVLVAVLFAVLVIAVAQSFQDRFKPLLFVNALGGLAILAGLGIGWWDAQQTSQRRVIERERDKFRALFENVPNPVIAARYDDGRLVAEDLNPAFAEVFGCTEADLAGRDLRTVLRPPDEEPERIESEARSIAPRPDGVADDDGWSEAAITLETDFGEREFVRVTAPIDTDLVAEDQYAYYVDVTERNQRQERLQVLSRTLRHDIRNRLDVAYGSAEVLEEDLDGEQASLAARVQSAIDDLQAISEQTREVEDVVSGEYEVYETDLSEIVQPAAAEIREEFPGVSLTVDLAETPTVQGNGALSVAVRNVLENAVVHNDTASPSVTVTAEQSRTGYLDLRVADDGPGIPDVEREIIENERERTQLTHMSGLGLWQVSWVLGNLGGSLEFAPNKPRGSVVTLRLPLSDTH